MIFWMLLAWLYDPIPWEVDDDDLPRWEADDWAVIALGENECAVSSCRKRTGSDVVYFCSYAHQMQWWSKQGRAA